MDGCTRKNPRAQVIGAVTDISIGNIVCSDCVVKDISINGIAITDMPIRVMKAVRTQRTDKIIAIIFKGAKRIKIRLLLKWAKYTDDTCSRVTAGFAMLPVMQPWVDFVRTNTLLLKTSNSIIDNTIKNIVDLWGDEDVKYMRV